ncbi:MAG: intradiol ring-cleavage dioxygenase, partial [bacterium]
MKQAIIILSLIVLLLSSANSQNRNERTTRLVGGPCEGCEAIFEYGDRNLSSIDTLPDFNSNGPKVKVTGT